MISTDTTIKEADTQHIKVLLIEDNPDHAELVREMLGEARNALFDMECAERLSTGLEYLGRESFDVVLSDLSLPDSLGLETFYEVRTHAPKVPVVVLSVLDDKELAVEAVHAGAQDYLVKGQVDSQLLERSIFYAIERKRSEEILGKAHEELETKVKLRTNDLAKTNRELQIEINERKLAQDALQRRNQVQSLFNDMLSISLKPYDLQEMLDRILNRIVSIPWLTHKSKGSILMIEDKPGELVTKSFREFSLAQQSLCAKVPIGRCLCGLAVSTKEVQFTSSLDDERHENTYEGITPHGHYCIPILSSEKALGVLNLYVKEGHPHSQEEEDYLCAIANCLAGIIERKHTEEELNRHRLYLQELVKEGTAELTKTNEQLKQEIAERKLAEEKTGQSYQVKSVINSILQISLEPVTLQEQLERVLDITLSIPWLNLQSRGAIFLVEDNSKTLTMKIQRGLSKPHETACGKINFGECFCGQAASRHEIQFSSCHNSSSNARYPDMDPHSHYCVPILFANRVIGVMVLYSDVGHKRNKDEEETLLAIARALAGIIERKKAEEALSTRQQEIKNLNKNLAIRVQEEVKKSRQKDFIMMHQSRLAAMGEMIGNIAHQWKQPLNALIFLLYNIKDHYDTNELTKESLYKLVKNGDSLIRKMSATVDDFRSFFKPNKTKEMFCANKTLKNSLSLVDASLRFNNISVNLHEEEEITVWGFANEYSQVILNVLNNAKDVIVAGGVNGEIKIDISHKDNFNVLKITDNAGGIPDEIINRIFDPYFTTKEEGKGAGIGLYMSKVIIEEHMDGSLDAQNNNGGAEFSIITPVPGPELMENGVCK